MNPEGSGMHETRASAPRRFRRLRRPRTTASAAYHGDTQFPIEVLYTRPDAISGGDALVRVSLRKNTAPGAMKVKLNGADITSSFVASGNALTGLVTGMRVGENLLEVIDPRGNVQGKGRADADIVLTNYPIEGPVFSGPHEQPFACATQQFNLPAGLGKSNSSNAR